MELTPNVESRRKVRKLVSSLLNIFPHFSPIFIRACNK
jgi:hypothetical protein